jgi:hypothetical protein
MTQFGILDQAFRALFEHRAVVTGLGLAIAPPNRAHDERVIMAHFLARHLLLFCHLEPNSMPMKSPRRNAARAALALGCVGLAASASQPAAADVLSGFYVSTDTGLNLTRDLNAPTASISLRPGVRGDASVGRAWKLAGEFSAAAELDAGILYNPLDKATTQGQSLAASGSLTDVPLLGHAVLRWQFHPHWLVYAGAGAGCTFSSLRIDSDGMNYGINGTDVDFAWQTMAGIRYQFGASEIGLGYEYFSFKRPGLRTVGNNTILASYTFCF